MKNICLPALLWALAMGQSFAQYQISPSAASQLIYWKDGLKQLLHVEDFELVPARPTVAVQTRSDLQLDSTLTFFEYDATGTQDSTPLIRTLHTYNSSLDAEVVLEERYELGVWTPQIRTTFISDDLDRPVDTYAESFDPAAQAWTLDSRVVLFPRGSSQVLLDSVFVYAWNSDNNDWARLMSTWNSYDDEGRVSESLTLIEIFGGPVLFKDAYSYDGNGDNTLIESFVVDGGVEYPSGKVELVYDNHFVTALTSFVEDGLGGFQQLDRYTYTYTSFWKEETVTSFVWDFSQNDWMPTQSEVYEYDTAERVSAMETLLFGEDGATTSERTTYAYLEDEYVDVEARYRFDFEQDEYVLLSRKYYHYSGGPVTGTPHEPLETRPLTVAPNPTAGWVQIQLTEAASVQVFDMQGQLVRWFDLQPGQATLDLYDLPAGIYQIRAQTENAYYASKLVRQ